MIISTGPADWNGSARAVRSRCSGVLGRRRRPSDGSAVDGGLLRYSIGVPCPSRQESCVQSFAAMKGISILHDEDSVEFDVRNDGNAALSWKELIVGDNSPVVANAPGRGRSRSRPEAFPNET